MMGKTRNEILDAAQKGIDRGRASLLEEAEWALDILTDQFGLDDSCEGVVSLRAAIVKARGQLSARPINLKQYRNDRPKQKANCRNIQRDLFYPLIDVVKKLLSGFRVFDRIEINYFEHVKRYNFY
jgi:hypothetical protein